MPFLRDDKDESLPDAHPINSFSQLKKLGILATLCFSGFLANYSIAAIQVAFVPMGKEFGVSPGLIPSSIGYNLLGLGCGTIFWNALSKSIGRRPTYLIGSALFIPCCIWMALCKTYPLFVAARVVAGLVSSFSQTVPPSSVADIFVRQVRGSKMSAYSTCVIIAPVVAPFICGLVVNKHSWPVVFWITLGLAVLQFLMFFFLVPETLWIPQGSSKNPNDPVHVAPQVSAASDSKEQDHTSTHKTDEEQISTKTNEDNAFPPVNQVLTHLDARTHTDGHCGAAWYPWQHPVAFLKAVIAPIFMVRFLVLTITSIVYGMFFAFSVGITIVMPLHFDAPPYNFGTIALGAAFLAFGIGGVLGKWSGGIVGDKVMLAMEKRRGVAQPEYRLHALPILFPFMVVGLILVGVTIQDELHWIAYLFGGGIFFFCLSAATGILQTYVLESYLTRSMDTQAVFIFFKSIWGFAVAYFIIPWCEKDGFLTAYGIQAALCAGLGIMLWSGLTVFGYSIRRAQGMPVAAKKPSM